MKFKVKFVFMFIVICTISEIKGLTGLEIYQHLSQSDNKDIQNICENDICSDSTSFFRNKLFIKEDTKEMFNRIEIRNDKLVNIHKIVSQYNSDLQIKEKNKNIIENKEHLNKLEEILKETQKEYDNMINYEPRHQQIKKSLYNNIRKLIEEKEEKQKNIITQENIIYLSNLDNKIKELQKKFDNIEHKKRTLYEKIKDLKEKKKKLEKNRENQPQHLLQEKDSNISIEDLASKIQKLKEEYSKEELLQNNKIAKDTCSGAIVEYFNNGYMVNIEIKPDHHFVIIKESQISETVSIFQAFAKFYTLKEWMNHYFSERINNIKNIQQFCELLNDVLSSNSTKAMALLFSIDKSKYAEEIEKYLKQNSGRITLENVKVWKPTGFILRRRIKRLFIKKSKK